MPDKTDKKQGKFEKGRSGNPLGRPRGIRNKATIAAEALFEGEIEGICRKVIEEAKRGNIRPLSKEGVKSRFPFASGITYEQQEILEIVAKEDFDRKF